MTDNDLTESQNQYESIKKRLTVPEARKDKMTLYQKYHLIIMCCGFTLSVGSLSMLSNQVAYHNEQTANQAKQIRNQTDSMRIQAYFEFVKNVAHMDKAFTEYPELRPIFFESKTIDKGTKLYQRALSVAETHLDIFESFYDETLIKHLPDISPGTKNREHWNIYMNDLFSNSILLCSRLGEAYSWYSDDLRKFASEPCSKHKIIIPVGAEQMADKHLPLIRPQTVTGEDKPAI